MRAENPGERFADESGESAGELLRADLRHAEHTRRDAVVAVKAFQEQLERRLTIYRSQRAWKIMVLLRKAYVLLMRRGWRNRLEFFRWVLGGRVRELPSAWELEFPDLRQYLPASLYTPFGAYPEVSGLRSEGGKMPVIYDVIVLPVFDFDFRVQRPQHLATQFAEQGHRVFWISAGHVLPQSSPEPWQLVELRSNIWEVRLRSRRRDIFREGFTSDDAERAIDCLRDLALNQAIAENCVIVQFPSWRKHASALRSQLGSRLVYDCMDNWREMPGVSAANKAEEEPLIRESDAVVASSATLQDYVARMRSRPVPLVRNACDYRFFARVEGEPAAEGKRAVAGYFGAIASWFDAGLLLAAARLRPQYTFVLAGASLQDFLAMGGTFAELAALANVQVVGALSYVEMPGLLASFDVCLLPFVCDGLGNATDPVKVYEYLSQGKPVVATPMQELQGISELIYTAFDPAGFAMCLDRAFQEADPEQRQRRRDFAKSNTWRKRFACLNNVIVETFEKVSIVIATHNSMEFAGPCFDAIAAGTRHPDYEVIVVDNASRDGTADFLKNRAASDSRIRVITCAKNNGFSAATNEGARAARGEYLVFLNPDTMVTPGWIEFLTRHCRRDPSIGLIVPITNCAGNEIQINVPYSNDAEMRDFALHTIRRNAGAAFDIPVAPLYCAVIRRSLWEQLGGLDERFEVGMFEDDDLSLRVRRAGLRVAAAEDCFVHHFGQGSFGRLPRGDYERIFERNRRRFEQKWNTVWSPHRYRPGVQADVVRFRPADFVLKAGGRQVDSARQETSDGSAA